MSKHEREVANSVAGFLRGQAQRAGWANDPAAWARDVLGVHMWSKQREIADSVATNKRTVVASCHGTGKALDLDTPIPTPDGLRSMGDLVAGSKVYGADGSIVPVVATTGAHRADRYRLILTDGDKETSVVASGDHLWPVMNTRARATADLAAQRAGMERAHLGTWHHLAQNLTTRELYARTRSYERFTVPGRIPVLAPQQGEWNPPESVVERLMSEGVCDVVGRPALQWTTYGQTAPAELVIMRAEMNVLGVKTLLHRRRINAAVVWTLSFVSDIAALLLPKPDDRALASNRLLVQEENRYDGGPAGWQIASIEKLHDGDVQCIQVGATDNLYLATAEGIPTHNSMIASVLACWWVSTRPVGEAIVVSSAPTYAQINKILWEEIRKHHATAKQRNMPMIGYVTQGDEWKTSDGKILAFGRKPATGNIHGFQGIHRKYVLAIGDECCHDDQTDVLTESGWKRFKDVKVSDRLLCMNRETHEAYYDLPVRLIDKPHSGDIAVYEGKGMNYAVTLDHDMYYGQRQKDGSLSWRATPHEEMTSWRNKAVLKTIKWAADDLPVLSDDLISLLGWFGAEGNFPANPNELRIYQSSTVHAEHYEEIVSLCVSLGLRHTTDEDHVRIFEPALRELLRPYGTTQLERRVPAFVRKLSTRQIELYLEAFWKGDGYLHTTQRIIYTSSPAMADDLQELILKTGAPSVVRRRDLSEPARPLADGRRIQATTDGFVVTWPTKGSELAWPKQHNVRVEHYEGRVYCATMPKDHLLFTRRGGYTMWSGNCGLPEEIWTGIEAITTGESCRMLYIGNPDDRNTEFGKVFLKPEMAGMWNRISVPASSTPNFTGEEVPPLLREVLVSKSWAEERLKAWGPNDPRYISKVDARFPDVSKSSLFPPALISQAFDEVPPQMHGGIARIGVDVARFGSDQTVVASYVGRTARIESEWSGVDTTSSAHQVLKIAEDVKQRTKSSWVEIRVDAVGLGAGVVDTLNARAVLTPEPWFSVYEMHGSAAAPRDLGGSVQGYGNARAYWFDQLRIAMRNTSVKIEEHEQLKDDLAIIFYSYRNGKLFIASKEDMKAKHGRSPDYADALTYATAPVADGPQPGDVLSTGLEEFSEELAALGDDWENRISPY